MVPVDTSDKERGGYLFAVLCLVKPYPTLECVPAWNKADFFSFLGFMVWNSQTSVKVCDRFVIKTYTYNMYEYWLLVQ